MAAKSTRKPKKRPVAAGAEVITAVLKAAAPRPDSSADRGAKNKYAVRFAEHMANRLASDLKPRLGAIEATTRRTAGSVGGKKQLDVNFSTRQLGLALGISLKSVHIREATGAKRYSHNMKRNEEELRIEAMGYHKRQPYAVMVGVLFLPFDSCDDGKKGYPSSFGSWVQHLRPYAGRQEPNEDADLFEKIHIALYEPDGSDLRFFDVQTDPPKNARPKALLSYEHFLDRVYQSYADRNHVRFAWADGEEEALDPESSLFGVDDDEES